MSTSVLCGRVRSTWGIRETPEIDQAWEPIAGTHGKEADASRPRSPTGSMSRRRPVRGPVEVGPVSQLRETVVENSAAETRMAESGMTSTTSQIPRAACPPIMPESHSTIAGTAGRWCALHTKSRNDKALAWDLLRLELPYFLPMVRMTRSYGGRRAEAVLPLFPGYVFAAVESDQDRYRILNTHRVARIIDVVDQVQIRTELEQIRRAVMSPHAVDLYPGIKKGVRCRVIAGSLRGVEGVVLMRREMGRIFLDVTMLGQSAVVEIDAMLLEPAS